MKEIKLRKGYDVGIIDGALSSVSDTIAPKLFAVKPPDFIGFKPKLLVDVGTEVKIATPLVYAKSDERIKLVSPVSGKVKEILRGERRVIEAVIIESDGKDDHEDFDVKMANRDEIINGLLLSGLFPLIKQRPFARYANPDDTPRDIFVSTMDTSPLAADEEVILKGNEDSFQKGLDVLSKITSGKVHLGIKSKENSFAKFKNCSINVFKGKHPAGNVGVQIHHIARIRSASDIVWTCSVQTIIMIGRLFADSKLDTRVVVKVSGTDSPVKQYFNTRAGAQILSIIGTIETDSRIISGNVLTGKKVSNDGFLGAFDNLISIIPEVKDTEFLGWLAPKFSTPSFWRTFASGLLTPKKKFAIDTRLGGGERALVVNRAYEDVLPMDIIPVYLIKSIITEDIEEMEALGIYEVAEEDLALCEYICPSKTEFQQIIRKGLDLIEKEG